MLIDLRLQPEEIKEQVIRDIIEEVVTERKSNVGIYFMKFCSKWDLQRISKYPDEFAAMLNAPYDDHLLQVHEELA